MPSLALELQMQPLGELAEAPRGPPQQLVLFLQPLNLEKATVVGHRLDPR
jgi:hypothetical protein